MDMTEPKDGIVKIEAIQKYVDQLEDLCTQKINAAEAFKGLCKKIGNDAGIDPGVLSQFITARVKDTESEFHAKATQLSLLFDEIT